MRKQAAFTLIELLVVVAIMAILMAILLPSLSKARDSAVTLKCLATLKSYDTANQIYAAETSLYYLPGSMDNGGVPTWFTGQRWYNNDLLRTALSLQPLNVATQSVSNCTPRALLCPRSYAALNPPASNGLYYVPYSYGMNMQNLSSLPTACRAFRVSQVLAPQLKMAFSDAMDWALTIGNGNKGETKYIEPPSYGENYYDTSQPYGGVAQMVAYRHNQRTNMVFFDGHGETLDLNTVKSKKNELYLIFNSN